MTDKLLNFVFAVTLICLCIFAVALFLRVSAYILFDTDIPFWVDYWVTNGGA